MNGNEGLLLILLIGALAIMMMRTRAAAAIGQNDELTLITLMLMAAGGLIMATLAVSAWEVNYLNGVSWKRAFVAELTVVTVVTAIFSAAFALTRLYTRATRDS